VRLNCPHCQNPIAVEHDPRAEDTGILCPACGSTFRIEQDYQQSWSPKNLPQLGRFKLLEAVGRGTFGTVYKARDTELNRIVAVKIPRSGHIVSNEDEERFVREARSVAGLHHPGIVPVYDVGREATFPYIVAEYVEGATLSDTLTRRRLGFREAAELIANVADALQHAHGHGVVHRDLKPSNIMLEVIADDGIGHLVSPGREVVGGETSTSKVTERNTRAAESRVSTRGNAPVNSPQHRTRLMDFGLALRDEGEATVTSDGEILGTPAYMSPEQARGEAHRVDGRSDVYSLGVILYQLLVGELPFRGNARMLLQQVLYNEPVAPHRLNDRIPRDLETITLKCLAKDPQRRYQAAADVAAELRRWLTGEPIQARPVGRIDRLWRWCRRKPAVAALSGTVAALLIAVAITATIVAVLLDRARSDAEERRLAAESVQRAESKVRRDALSLERASKRTAARSLLDQGTVLCEAGELGKGLLQLSRSLELAPVDEPDLQDAIRRNLAAWALLKMPILKTQLKHDSEPVRVALSFDGKKLVTGTASGLVQWWTEVGEPWGTPFHHRSLIQAVTLSHDGTALLTASENGLICLWDTNTGAVSRSPLVLPNFRLRAAALAPDKKKIVAASGYTVQQWSLERTQPIGLMSLASKHGPPIVHGREVSCVAYSPDGTLILSASTDGTAQLWDSSTGAAVHGRLKHGEGEVRWAAFSLDGKWLVTVGSNRLGRLWSASTGEAIGAPMTHKGFIESATFRPPGTQILTGGTDGKATFWDGATLAHKGPILDHMGWVHSATFSRDSDFLLTGSRDRIARLWRIPPEIDFTAYPHSQIVRAIACDSVRARFFTGDWGGVIQEWSTETSSRIGRPNSVGSAIRGIALSPDGTTAYIATNDGIVRVWNVSEAVVKAGLKHPFEVFAVALSRNGDRLCTGSIDAQARIWDTATNTLKCTLRGHSSHVWAVAFDHTGSKVATGSWDQTVLIWDADTGERLVGPLKLPGWVLSVSFSPDGRELLTGCHDGKVRRWDVGTGEFISVCAVHPHAIESVRYHPNGQTALTASGDGTARLWNIALGVPIGPAFSNNGPELEKRYSLITAVFST
jgi:WD40 repeat protein/serine/threonine protein kinase